MFWFYIFKFQIRSQKEGEFISSDAQKVCKSKCKRTCSGIRQSHSMEANKRTRTSNSCSLKRWEKMKPKEETVRREWSCLSLWSQATRQWKRQTFVSMHFSAGVLAELLWLWQSSIVVPCRWRPDMTPHAGLHRKLPPHPLKPTELPPRIQQLRSKGNRSTW